jgi:hypothetical protein
MGYGVIYQYMYTMCNDPIEVIRLSMTLDI